MATPIGQEQKKEEPRCRLRLLLTYSFIIIPKKLSLNESGLKIPANTMALQFLIATSHRLSSFFQQKQTIILKINCCTSQRNEPSIHISYDCSDTNGF